MAEQIGGDLNAALDWIHIANDLTRIEMLEETERNDLQCIVLKLESPQEANLVELVMESDSANRYDCLAEYKHQD